TPRYDYNQIMYKLDLGDPRLVLPVPFYSLAETGPPDRFFGTIADLKPKLSRPVAFFALDRPKPGAVEVYAIETTGGRRGLRVGVPPNSPKPLPVFYALPADAKDLPATATPLYEFVHSAAKKRAYSTKKSWTEPGYERAEKPICLVWRNPLNL